MPFSEQQVDRAISRLSSGSNRSINQVMENARTGGSARLVEACEDELATRGSLDLTREGAERAAEISARTAAMELAQVVELAFREVPAKPEEITILRWIASHPGTSAAETEKAYGVRDTSLVIGHIIYHRFGYFRPFLQGKTQSDLLLKRTMIDGRMHYSIRPELLGILDRVCGLGVGGREGT